MPPFPGAWAGRPGWADFRLGGIQGEYQERITSLAPLETEGVCEGIRRDTLSQRLESATFIVFTVIIAVRTQPTITCAAPRPLSPTRLAIITPKAMPTPTRAA